MSEELLSQSYFILLKKSMPEEFLLRVSNSSEILLNFGAKGRVTVFEIEPDKMYPIEAAILLRLKGQVELLIHNESTNASISGLDGSSPLFSCLNQALLRKKDNLDYQVEIEIAKCLIVNGADMLRKDTRSGFTPLQYAKQFPELSSWYIEKKQ